VAPCFAPEPRQQCRNQDLWRAQQSWWLVEEQQAEAWSPALQSLAVPSLPMREPLAKASPQAVVSVGCQDLL
jgi:hypothetical protein